MHYLPDEKPVVRQKGRGNLWISYIRHLNPTNPINSTNPTNPRFLIHHLGEKTWGQVQVVGYPAREISPWPSDWENLASPGWTKQVLHRRRVFGISQPTLIGFFP